MSRVGGPRIAAAVVALAVVGTVIGYLAGLWSHDEPNESGKATPLVASSPSAPINLPVDFKPDNDYPTLGVDLEYVDATLGSGNFQVTLPVPTGWTESESALVEKTWSPPGDSRFTYRLRVELVGSEHASIEAMVTKREKELASATGIDDFKVISRSADSLSHTYVKDKHLRLEMRRWVAPFGSSEAEVEISVVGRMKDRDGLDRLLDRVTDGIAKS